MPSKKAKKCDSCGSPKPLKCWGCGKPMLPPVTIVSLPKHWIGLPLDSKDDTVAHFDCLGLVQEKVEKLKKGETVLGENAPESK